MMFVFFQAEDGIRDLVRSRGLGDVYKRQPAQRYAGLGIEHGRFEGWVMENRKDAAPPGDLVAEFPARHLHLVEWKTPAPTGPVSYTHLTLPTSDLV